jgi:hypothetical protein
MQALKLGQPEFVPKKKSWTVTEGNTAGKKPLSRTPQWGKSDI